MNSMEDVLRIGVVSSVHPERHCVRVTFEDKDGMVSNELPVIVRGSLKNKEQFLPDVGEFVLCCFLPNGEEEGFMLGAFYSDKDTPVVQDKEEYLLKIPGGACLSVNRKKHEIYLKDHHGSAIVLKEGDIILKSARHIHLNPDGGVSVPEHISTQFD